RASRRVPRRGTGLPRPGRPPPPRRAASPSGLLPPLERAAAPLEERDAAPHGAHGCRHVEHRCLHFFLHHFEQGVQLGEPCLRSIRGGDDPLPQLARRPPHPPPSLPNRAPDPPTLPPAGA